MYLMDSETEPTALIDDVYDYVGGNYETTYKNIELYDINYEKTWLVLEQDGENYAACVVYDQSLDQVKKSIDELDGGQIAHDWDNVTTYTKINGAKDIADLLDDGALDFNNVADAYKNDVVDDDDLADIFNASNERIKRAWLGNGGHFVDLQKAAALVKKGYTVNLVYDDNFRNVTYKDQQQALKALDDSDARGLVAYDDQKTVVAYIDGVDLTATLYD